jgi:hypothetical protein
MARVRSITRSCENVAEGECTIIERDVTSDSGDSRGSPERTVLAQASDAGLHSGVGDDCYEGSCT